ncbi:MAG: ABC transporter permease [Saprospiraceae bacterium]|nr:ABC transporter permease [Saprospiraceae bacterium]
MSEKIIITSSNSNKNYFKDIWNFRELLYILSWRDIKVRYKQTIIGILWAILRPLTIMILFTIVFKYFLGLRAVDNIPYYLLVLVGLLPWYLFSSAMTEASNSLMDNEKLITKVYFPRIIVPISSVVTSFIDFLVSFILLIILLIFNHISFLWNFAFIPLVLLVLLLFSLGIGFFLSALNVRYRDFRYVIPFITQIGYYVSPIGYSSNSVPLQYQHIYFLNPMAGIIETFRWCIFGGALDHIKVMGFTYSAILSVVIFIIGLYFFKQNESQMADLI